MSGTTHPVAQRRIQAGLNPQASVPSVIVLMGEIFGTDKFLLYQDSVCGQVLLYLSFVFCTLHMFDVSKF
jgi:hypothetical protein